MGPRVWDLRGGLGSGTWGVAWDLGPGAVGLCLGTGPKLKGQSSKSNCPIVKQLVTVASG